MLTLEPLRADQYRQVAEWEHGPQPDADWDAYAEEMNQPQWTRFGLYIQGELAGCLSLEKLCATMTAFHVVTVRRKIHPGDLARTLLDVAGNLFEQGCLACVAHAPIKKREVARLALRCGMWEFGRSETTRYFILTNKRYLKNANAEA